MKRKTIQGEDHALVLLKVEEKDAFGRPTKCTIGYDDAVFDIKGGEEFITAWVPSKLIVPQTKGDA